MASWFEAQIDESIVIAQSLRRKIPLLTTISQKMVAVFRQQGQVFFFGNGGSAADAQHWAAELSGRFYVNRPSLPAVALTTNTSQITAIANDFGYDDIFARPLMGMAHAGDMAVGISTSGTSANVCQALKAARHIGLSTVGFTGATGGSMDVYCDFLVSIPSQDVARIQEGHELCAHLICAAVERTLFPSS